MKLTIGGKIRSLRRQRDLTQEEMAAHLGISFQAISKWERGDGYPDITMLPILANYFSVSIDELMGLSESAKLQKLQELNRIWEENDSTGLHRKNVDLMKEGLRIFPNHGLLLAQLSVSLEKLDGTEEEKADNLRKSIAVQEQILRYGEDSEIRGAALYNICFSYWKLGERSKAAECARRLLLIRFSCCLYTFKPFSMYDMYLTVQ